MYHVTPAEAEELMTAQRRAQSRVDALKRKDDTFKSLAWQVGESTVSAAAFGMLRGMGKGDVRSVPIDLCVGAVLLGCAFAMNTRKASPHLANVGCGAMASFGASMGGVLGAKIQANKTATSGEAEFPLMLGAGNPIPTRGPLSDPGFRSGPRAERRDMEARRHEIT